MWLAASKGNTGEVKYQLDGGINVNVRDKNGDTSLHLAALRGHVDTMTALLDTPGCDPNLKNDV